MEYIMFTQKKYRKVQINMIISICVHNFKIYTILKICFRDELLTVFNWQTLSKPLFLEYYEKTIIILFTTLSVGSFKSNQPRNY